MNHIWLPSRSVFIAIALLLASVPALARSHEVPRHHDEPARDETPIATVAAQSDDVPDQHDEVPEGTTADAFRIQAEKYAADVGVSVEEAMCRLELQGLVSELSTELHAHASDVLGGLRIEHKPDFRVIVSVIPGGEARVQALIDNSPLSNLATIETVELTETELENEQLRLNDQLNQLGIRFSSGIFGQEIRIFVDDADEFMQRAWEAGIRLPEFVVVDDTTGVGEFFGGTPGGSNSSEPPTNGTAGP